MKKVLFVCLFLMFGNHTLGQQGNKLLVYTSGEQFLRLKVETYLRNLTDTLGTEARSSLIQVKSLNSLLKSDLIQTKVRDAITTFDPSKALAISKKDDNYLTNIATELNNYDLFLNVNVRSLLDLIEYQLELYRFKNVDLIKEENNQTAFLRLVESSSIGNANFFVDPKKGDYLLDLNDGIRSLFRSANVLPEPLIQINGKEFGSRTFNVGLRDTTILDASQSKYLGNDFSNLKFEWTLLEFNDSRPSETHDLDFIANSTIQKIVFPDIGLYKIGLKIWDGIAYSKEQYAYVRVLENPTMHLRRKSFEYARQGMISDVFLGTEQLRKSLASKAIRGSTHFASTSGNSRFMNSTVKNYKTEAQRLKSTVDAQILKGRNHSSDSISFEIKKTDSLGNDVYKNTFEVQFPRPGDYWMIVFDESQYVRSNTDTISFRYYYRAPLELDLFQDHTATTFLSDDLDGEFTSTLFLGVKFYILRIISIDLNAAIWNNQRDKLDYGISLSRIGVSARFSNTFFKLENLTNTVIDGYFGFYTNDLPGDNYIATTGLKIAPHRKLLNRNTFFEYFVGLTVNYGALIENPIGFQYGVTITPLILN